MSWMAWAKYFVCRGFGYGYEAVRIRVKLAFMD
jgi:hypothetical protein